MCDTEMHLVWCAVYAQARKIGIIYHLLCSPTLLTHGFKGFLKALFLIKDFYLGERECVSQGGVGGAGVGGPHNDRAGGRGTSRLRAQSHDLSQSQSWPLTRLSPRRRVSILLWEGGFLRRQGVRKPPGSSACLREGEGKRPGWRRCASFPQRP